MNDNVVNEIRAKHSDLFNSHQYRPTDRMHRIFQFRDGCGSESNCGKRKHYDLAHTDAHMATQSVSTNISFLFVNGAVIEDIYQHHLLHIFANVKQNVVSGSVIWMRKGEWCLQLSWHLSNGPNATTQKPVNILQPRESVMQLTSGFGLSLQCEKP